MIGNLFWTLNKSLVCKDQLYCVTSLFQYILHFEREDILYQVPIFFILNIFWYKKFLIWINSWKLNYAVTWFDKVFVMGGLFWRISFIIFNPLFFTPIFLSSERGQCLLKLTKVLYDGITWFYKIYVRWCETFWQSSSWFASILLPSTFHQTNKTGHKGCTESPP